MYIPIVLSVTNVPCVTYIIQALSYVHDVYIHDVYVHDVYVHDVYVHSNHVYMHVYNALVIHA